MDVPKATLEASVYDKAFDIICKDEIDNRIIDGKEILLLSNILKKFKEAVIAIDPSTDEDIPYQTSRLKKRIESRYPESIVFHQSKSRNKGILIYSTDLVVGEIADEAMKIDETDSGDNDHDGWDHEVGR